MAAASIRDFASMPAASAFACACRTRASRSALDSIWLATRWPWADLSAATVSRSAFIRSMVALSVSLASVSLSRPTCRIVMP
jgi:hypothetical protein